MADITVEVSSAGLLAYGANEYGSGNYGGDNSPQVQVQTVDSFNNSGWGRLSWNSLVWGQDFQDVTVQVTTPGTGTPWGQDVWGDAGWGQISGMDTDQGSSELTVSVDVALTGIEKTITLQGAVAGTSVLIDNLTGLSATTSQGDVFGGELVVVEVTSPSNDEWGTEAWGNGFWGVGDGLTVFVSGETEHVADANVFPTGVSANGSIGTAEIPVVIDTGISMSLSQGNAFGGELVEVQVTTASAQPWGEVGFGEGQWGQSVGTDIAQGGEEVAVPSVEVDVTGIQLNGNIGVETVTGDSNLSLTGFGLTLQQGDEDAFTNIRINVSGNNIGTIVIGDYLTGFSAEAPVTSVTGTVNTGIIGLNAWAVVDPDGDTTWTVVDLAA